MFPVVTRNGNIMTYSIYIYSSFISWHPGNWLSLGAGRGFAALRALFAGSARDRTASARSKPYLFALLALRTGEKVRAPPWSFITPDTSLHRYWPWPCTTRFPNVYDAMRNHHRFETITDANSSYMKGCDCKNDLRKTNGLCYVSKWKIYVHPYVDNHLYTFAGYVFIESWLFNLDRRTARRHCKQQTTTTWSDLCC